MANIMHFGIDTGVSSAILDWLCKQRRKMKTNCCVPGCVADSKRHFRLKFYALPTKNYLKRKWVKLLRNKALKTDSKYTSVCSLHFKSGRKTYETNVPTLFPWSREWTDLVQTFNSETEKWFEKQQANDHSYVKKPPRLSLTPMSKNKTTSRRKSRNSRKTQEVIFLSPAFLIKHYIYLMHFLL